jgi:AcrR family transcriptional regulator
MKEGPVPDRRAKLLDEVADYILSNGLAGLSLRPLAATIDTSPRMLLYFFGSKERLIAQALARIRTREQLDFRRAVSRSTSADREGLLLREWESWSSPRREKYLRLFFEVYGLALQNRERFPGFLEGAVGEWLPLVERAFAVAVAREPAQALATLALAAVRGLQLDLLATGQRSRTEAAFQEMLRLLSLAIRSDTKSNGPRRKDGRRPSNRSKALAV